MDVAPLLFNRRIMIVKHCKADNPRKVAQPYISFCISNAFKVKEIYELLYISDKAELDWLIILVELFLDLKIIDSIRDDHPCNLFHLRVNPIKMLVVLSIKILNLRHHEHLLPFICILPVKSHQASN